MQQVLYIQRGISSSFKERAGKRATCWSFKQYQTDSARPCNTHIIFWFLQPIQLFLKPFWKTTKWKQYCFAACTSAEHVYVFLFDSNACSQFLSSTATSTATENVLSLLLILGSKILTRVKQKAVLELTSRFEVVVFPPPKNCNEIFLRLQQDWFFEASGFQQNNSINEQMNNTMRWDGQAFSALLLCQFAIGCLLSDDLRKQFHSKKKHNFAKLLSLNFRLFRFLSSFIFIQNGFWSSLVFWVVKGLFKCFCVFPANFEVWYSWLVLDLHCSEGFLWKIHSVVLVQGSQRWSIVPCRMCLKRKFKNKRMWDDVDACDFKILCVQHLNHFLKILCVQRWGGYPLVRLPFVLSGSSSGQVPLSCSEFKEYLEKKLKLSSKLFVAFEAFLEKLCEQRWGRLFLFLF